MKDKHVVILNAIKSLLELGYVASYNKEINLFLKNIEFVDLKTSLINQIRRKNIGKAIAIIDTFLYDNTTKSHLFHEFDIRLFDFDFLEGMNLTQIISRIEVKTLNFNTIKDNPGSLNFRHWENNGRFQILIEKSLLEKINTNENMLLYLSKATNASDKGYYTSFEILDNEDLYDDGSDENDSYNNGVDWDLWDDDLDSDQQDPDFWNQF
jgi:hypothetical protein